MSNSDQALTSSDLTATERLRELLDERGAEYETYTEQPTGFEHVKWSFGEHGSADFNLEFGVPWLTMYGEISGPEQAIDATLGRETCRPVDGYDDDGEDIGEVCSACGETWPYFDARYCPNCGAEVTT